MLEGILIEGLIFGILALGVFISFRILDFPDLTVDGSFPLGAAIMVACLVNGYGVIIAFILSFIGGLGAGALTAFLHNKLKIPNLLSGILTMTILYSVNIRIMGNRANLPIGRNTETIITIWNSWTSSFLGSELSLLILFIVIVLVVKIIIDIFFRMDLGISLGAMGGNEQMVISQGLNPKLLKIIGVGFSNGLVAISGACYAQYQGFADVGMGPGSIVAGLAIVMLGEFIIKSNKIHYLTLRVIFGAIIYKGIMFVGRKYGYYLHMSSSDLNMLTTILTIIMIYLSRFKPIGNKKGK